MGGGARSPAPRGWLKVVSGGKPVGASRVSAGPSFGARRAPPLGGEIPRWARRGEPTRFPALSFFSPSVVSRPAKRGPQLTSPGWPRSPAPPTRAAAAAPFPRASPRLAAWGRSPRLPPRPPVRPVRLADAVTGAAPRGRVSPPGSAAAPLRARRRLPWRRRCVWAREGSVSRRAAPFGRACPSGDRVPASRRDRRPRAAPGGGPRAPARGAPRPCARVSRLSTRLPGCHVARRTRPPSGPPPAWGAPRARPSTAPPRALRPRPRVPGRSVRLAGAGKAARRRAGVGAVPRAPHPPPCARGSARSRTLALARLSSRARHVRPAPGVAPRWRGLPGSPRSPTWLILPVAYACLKD